MKSTPIGRHAHAVGIVVQLERRVVLVLDASHDYASSVGDGGRSLRQAGRAHLLSKSIRQ